MRYELINLLMFIVSSLTISFILLIISKILIVSTTDYEKLLAYECGFDPFETALTKFDIKFYIISIIFILFDLEISFLFPWTLTIVQIDIIGYISIFTFLLILLIGFIYEWQSGTLEW